MNLATTGTARGTGVDCLACGLHSICLPRGLRPTGLLRLMSAMPPPQRVLRGEHLYRVTDPFRGLYTLKSGMAKIYRLGSDGIEVIAHLALPGEVFGFDGLASGRRYQWCAVVLESTSICRLPAAELEHLYADNSDLAWELMQQCVHWMSDAHRRLAQASISAEQRVACFLVDLSARLAQRGFTPHELNMLLTRREIGAYLGVALETVSRILGAFAKQGLIEVRGRRIHLKKPDELLVRAEGS